MSNLQSFNSIKERDAIIAKYKKRLQKKVELNNRIKQHITGKSPSLLNVIADANITKTQEELIRDNSYQRDLLYKRLKPYYSDLDISVILSKMSNEAVVLLNKLWSRYLKFVESDFTNTTPEDFIRNTNVFFDSVEKLPDDQKVELISAASTPPNLGAFFPSAASTPPAAPPLGPPADPLLAEVAEVRRNLRPLPPRPARAPDVNAIAGLKGKLKPLTAERRAIRDEQNRLNDEANDVLKATAIVRQSLPETTEEKDYPPDDAAATETTKKTNIPIKKKVEFDKSLFAALSSLTGDNEIGEKIYKIEESFNKQTDKNKQRKIWENQVSKKIRDLNNGQNYYKEVDDRRLSEVALNLAKDIFARNGTDKIKNKLLTKVGKPKKAKDTKAGSLSAPVKVKYANIGTKALDLDYLHRNRLRLVYGGSKHKIAEFPEIVISHELAQLIYQFIINDKFDVKDYKKLKKSEQLLFDKMLELSKMSPKETTKLLNVKKESDTVREKTLKKLKLLSGQILAGNDNPKLLKEFKATVLKAYNERYISRADYHKLLEILISL